MPNYSLRKSYKYTLSKEILANRNIYEYTNNHLNIDRMKYINCCSL